MQRRIEMFESYDRVDTIKYFNGFSTTPALEYVVLNNISDFQPKMSSHLLTEICLCTEGSGFFQIDNEHIPFQKGDVVIINPYVLHGSGASDKETLQYYILGIKNIQFASSDEAFKYLYQLNGNRLPSYVDLLWSEIKDEFDSSRISIVRNLLTIILTELKCITSTNVIPFSKKETSIMADSIAQYINRHFNQKITLDELAKIFFCSKSTLMHTFKKAYGTSVLNYLMDRRLQEVKMWLKISNMPINLIAQENGFSSLPYFYKYFAANVGMTPLEYRNQAQEKIK